MDSVVRDRRVRTGDAATHCTIPGGKGQSRTLDRLVHNQTPMAPLSGGGLKLDLNFEVLDSRWSLSHEGRYGNDGEPEGKFSRLLASKHNNLASILASKYAGYSE